MHTGIETVNWASNSAFLTFGKIRIRSLPISSLPLLVLLHWDIGNDGEPHCACAAGAASRWERWCTLPPELRYISSAWQKLGVALSKEWRTTGSVGGVTHTEPESSVVVPTAGSGGLRGSSESFSCPKWTVFHVSAVWLVLCQSKRSYQV